MVQFFLMFNLMVFYYVQSFGRNLRELVESQILAERLVALALRKGKEGLMAQITVPRVIATWVLEVTCKRHLFKSFVLFNI